MRRLATIGFWFACLSGFVGLMIYARRREWTVPIPMLMIGAAVTLGSIKSVYDCMRIEEAQSLRNRRALRVLVYGMLAVGLIGFLVQNVARVIELIKSLFA